MATDTGGLESTEQFSRISRTTGTIFKYTLLAGTLVGIVALGILLLYVANDAIQPLTADPGWYLVFFATFVLPTVAVGWYLNQTSGVAFSTGITTIGMLLVGTIFAAGISTVFIDVVYPLMWFAYFVAFAVPIAFAIGLSRSDFEIPFLGWLGITVLTFGASLVLVPYGILRLLYIPTNGMSIALTFGSVAALAGRSYVSKRWDEERTANIAAGIILLVTILSPFVGAFTGIGAVPAPILTTMALVPVGLYVADTVAHRPENNVGLALPVAIIGGALLGAFLVDVLSFAGPQSWLDWGFVTGNSSSTAADAGLYPAIVGSVLLMFVVSLVSFPLGVGAAVYLEEYAPDNKLTRIVTINVSNLAGVPSVVYGLLGAGVFVTYLGPGIPVLPPAIANPLGLTPIYVAGNLFGSGTIVVGGLALSLLILPIIIISSQEAIRAVPNNMRQASYGMGATQWQTVKNVVLPRAFPGILTGTILGLGRAVGETAPLIMIGAAAIAPVPRTFESVVAAMPMQIYVWAGEFATPEFFNRVVPAGVIVLLVAMLAMNSVAIALRNKYQKEG
ncbi:phosphate ABC transporter permease PstA [Haladaptatus cibarius]|uniref:phosphate ABC transporter permease PstA n=1 Tax=Haladaptatus cibarius TaxID=453847 RepID=UPI000679E381|nr:phosphate ABC transporter permease PstA [Haladaptatus cibarius]